MTVDWSKFQRDVERLYLQERQSAMQTVAHINQKHGSNITLRQFKSRFGGLKKLQAKEWMAIISVIRKSTKGDKFTVYLYNRQQCPKRVERAFKLYGGKSEDSKAIGIDLGINTVNQHRIEVRTAVNNCIDLTIDSELEECTTTDITRETSSNMAETPQTVTPEDMIWSYGDMPTTPNFLSNDDKIQKVEAEQSSVDSTVEDSKVPLIDSTQWNFDQPELSIQEYFLTAGTLGYEHLKTSRLPYPSFWVEIKEMHIFTLSIHDWSYHTRPPSNIPIINQTYQHVARGADGWLFSHLMNADSNLESLENAAFQVEAITSGLQNHSLISLKDVNEQTLNQIFLIMVYLVSNDDLEEASFSYFMFWVINNDFIQHLNLFLCMIFSYGLVFRNHLLRMLPKLRSHNQSEQIAPCLLTQHPNAFLEIVRKADKRVLHGKLGTEILTETIRSNHWEAVQYLVSEGVDVNGDSSRGIPLAEAAAKGSTHILTYLIKHGADPNCNKLGSALYMAIKHRRFAAANLLLDAGARLDVSFNLQGIDIVQFLGPAPHNELRGYVTINEVSKIYSVIDAAEKGEDVLSQYLLEYEMVKDETLERALCFAIKSGNEGAVRALLYLGIDPRVPKYKSQQMRINGEGYDDGINPLILASNCEEHTMQNILYYLRKAGLQLESETLQNYDEKCKNGGFRVSDPYIIALAKAGFDIQVVGPAALEVVALQSNRNSGHWYGDALFQCGIWLDSGCPINHYGLRGLSGLQAAAKSGNLTLVLEFIKRGADVNLPASYNGLTALQAAAKSGKSTVVDCLLAAEADCKLPPAVFDGFTVLEAAAYPESGDATIKETEILKILERLIEVGAPLNRDGNATRLILGLITSNFMDCLKLVLEKGAEVEGMTSISRGIMLSPLQIAAMQLNLRAIELLIAKKADVNAPAYPSGGYTALQAAMLKCDIASEQLRVVTLLLKSGADVNARPKSETGRTALQEATLAENANLDIINLLVLYGAKVNASPTKLHGFTALQGAAMRGNLRIMTYLLNSGADVSAPAATVNGRTAIEAAAENGKYDALKLLLNHSEKSPNTADGFGRAIEFASKNNHWHIADFLQEHEKLMQSCR